MKDNYFLDTEFNERVPYIPETGFVIDPISWGLVHEDGKGFYGVSSQFNEAAAFQWLREHVIAKLPMYGRKTIAEIREGILDFFRPAKEVDIWAYNGGTDKIVLYKPFGDLMAFQNALKERHGIERVTFQEMKTLHMLCGKPPLPEQPEATQHIALPDAQHERDSFIHISRHIRENAPHLIPIVTENLNFKLA